MPKLSSTPGTLTDVKGGFFPIFANDRFLLRHDHEMLGRDRADASEEQQRRIGARKCVLMTFCFAADCSSRPKIRTREKP